MLHPNAKSRQMIVSVQTVARWLAAPAVAMALLGLTACSSPTPSTPGQIPNELSDTQPGDAEGNAGAGEAPAMGMPTMIPPGGGEEYFSITVEPTDDLGYPPPPTLTWEEKQLDAYPAPGEATTDENGGEVDADEPGDAAGDEAEDTADDETSESGEDAGEDEGEEGDEGGDEG